MRIDNLQTPIPADKLAGMIGIQTSSELEFVDGVFYVSALFNDGTRASIPYNHRQHEDASRYVLAQVSAARKAGAGLELIDGAEQTAFFDPQHLDCVATGQNAPDERNKRITRGERSRNERHSRSLDLRGRFYQDGHYPRNVINVTFPTQEERQSYVDSLVRRQRAEQERAFISPRAELGIVWPAVTKKSQGLHKWDEYLNANDVVMIEVVPHRDDGGLAFMPRPGRAEEQKAELVISTLNGPDYRHRNTVFIPFDNRAQAAVAAQAITARINESRLHGHARLIPLDAELGFYADPDRFVRAGASLPNPEFLPDYEETKKRCHSDIFYFVKGYDGYFTKTYHDIDEAARLARNANLALQRHHARTWGGAAMELAPEEVSGDAETGFRLEKVHGGHGLTSAYRMI